MRNPIDAAIEYVAPRWALKRAQARNVMAYYEAARKDKQRKQRREPRDAETALQGSAASLREQARHFEQNSELARGVLSILVDNTVGHRGIQFEPMPMTRGGEYHERFALEIQRVLRTQAHRPEMTWQFNGQMMQRIMARTWFRDGEAFAQIVSGTGAAIRHGTEIPYSLKLFEPDLIPFEHSQWRGNSQIVNGCEINGWGRPVAWWIYKDHPGQHYADWTLKRIRADRIIHLCSPDRLHQRRGVSFFATTFKRIDDIKDYDESERIAAKVAASMGFAIKRGSPDSYALPEEETEDEEREWKMRPGMGFELEIGESIEMIGSNGRPSSDFESFRSSQLRALASGPGVTYSSLSKRYDGTYSSQRQELVEGYIHYAVLADDFTARFVEPYTAGVIEMALLSGDLVMPRDVDPETVTHGLFIAPQMPWIDPQKEADANEKLEQAGHASGPEIVRRRGRNPLELFESEKRWRKRWADAGLSITADPSAQQTTGTQSNEQSDSMARLVRN